MKHYICIETPDKLAKDDIASTPIIHGITEKEYRNSLLYHLRMWLVYHVGHEFVISTNLNQPDTSSVDIFASTPKS